MSKQNDIYLNHLIDCIPPKANNYMLSTYSIILEAWRRGIEVSVRIVKEKSGNIEPYYSLKHGTKFHNFSVTRGDLVSVEAKELTKNKHTTKEYLQSNNVPTPIGKEFSNTATDEDIIKYANEIGYPVVVKPLAGTGGKGVMSNIQNRDELVESLLYVRQQLKFSHVILEKYFEGADYRLYVLDGDVIGAIKRVRAHVIGDGKKTIQQLINDKNTERTKLPSLSNRPIKVDSETKTLLKRSDYTLQSIIPDGEIFYLKTKNNVSAGGDSIDITNQVSDNIKKIAIEAANSFPSLPHCGLDMIVDEENDTGVIIELNSRAHITQHLFPMEGKAQDIPSYIVDYYFPETKGYNREEANKLFIDFDFIYTACLSRSAAEIKLPTIPKSPLVLKRYVITGCSESQKFAARVHRLAYNNQVNGYVKPLTEGKLAIIMGANSDKVMKFESQLKNYINKNFPEVKVEEKNRTSPIKHGFYIEKDTEELSGKTTNSQSNTIESYAKKYSDLRTDYQKLVRKLSEYEQSENLTRLTERQNKQLKKRLKQMESSTSWKITKPIRKLMGIRKR
ncbi:ATP-binding protein [Oceanobacillus manasiensis]|uniref:ATP-binding protein n=1 Tax=Oceanobacillus manasiensis TaxID=586413 RepID=UPI0005AB6D94|nr:ATP-grasp domain-containing protein [Oceanobacillus manasiensis]